MIIIHVLHAMATWGMVGIIWFVQLVHYPLFCYVPWEGFGQFSLAYQHRTSFVIVPLMLAELVTAVVIACHLPIHVLACLGLVLLGGIWISTFLIQVPLHKRLALGFHPIVHRRLVRTNWLRTILWSVRGALAIVLLFEALSQLSPPIELN